MIHLVTKSSFAAIVLLVTPAIANAQADNAKSATQNAGKPQDNVRVTERDVSATDIATTPVSDLNLKKDEIPAVLLTAQSRTYDLAGLRRCPALAAAVTELDSVLGDDFDLPQDAADRLNTGKMAQSVVGSFIPFRSVIREISGANEQQRKMRLAIEAGLARRAFLKGFGEARGCGYPARSASAAHVAQRRAAAQAEQDKSDDKKR